MNKKRANRKKSDWLRFFIGNDRRLRCLQLFVKGRRVWRESFCVCYFQNLFENNKISSSKTIDKSETKKYAVSTFYSPF